MLWYATVLFKNNNNEDFKVTFFNTAVTETRSKKKNLKPRSFNFFALTFSKKTLPGNNLKDWKQ